MAAVRRRVRHARQFLAENAKKEGVISLPSGLQYKVIESGSGIKPRPGDRVTVHYRGTLINGSEFEYSYPTGAPAIVWLEDAIPGFQYALASMSMAPADPPPGSGGSRRRRATNSRNWPALARRVGRFLERQGLLERDAENSYLAGDAVGEDQMDLLLGDAITYRIAVGLQAGRTVFTLQTLPASDSGDGFTDRVGAVSRVLAACGRGGQGP